MKLKSIYQSEFLKLAWMPERKLNIKLKIREEIYPKAERVYYGKKKRILTGREAFYSSVQIGRLYASVTLTPYLRLPEKVQIWFAKRGIV